MLLLKGLAFNRRGRRVPQRGKRETTKSAKSSPDHSRVVRQAKKNKNLFAFPAPAFARGRLFARTGLSYLSLFHSPLLRTKGSASPKCEIHYGLKTSE